MAAYYNEFDPFAAAWLRELIADGLIVPGEVDTRSIEDVHPDDLRGFAQCHFFAGIGVWSAALRRAGWADDRSVWTGSCPCQPFSAAGKGGGFADERHLWPAFFHLIRECRPDVVFGEQVASKDGLAWLDLVQADLEGAEYASGAVDTCAAGFGAPHIRQRLYWVADAMPAGRAEWRPGAGLGSAAGRGEPRQRLANNNPRLEGRRQSERERAFERVSGAGCAEDNGRPGPVNGLWAVADWLGCRDGKWRPVEPGAFPLAHAGAFRNRVGELRGAGNAINLAQATGFIEAYLAA